MRLSIQYIIDAQKHENEIRNCRDLLNWDHENVRYD
jgi:hypothetical protein